MPKLLPPIRTPMFDPKTGLVTTAWAAFYQALVDTLDKKVDA